MGVIFCPGYKDTHQDINSEFFGGSRIRWVGYFTNWLFKGYIALVWEEGEMLRHLHTWFNRYNLKTKDQVFNNAESPRLKVLAHTISIQMYMLLFGRKWFPHWALCIGPLKFLFRAQVSWIPGKMTIYISHTVHSTGTHLTTSLTWVEGLLQSWIFYILSAKHHHFILIVCSIGGLQFFINTCLGLPRWSNGWDGALDLSTLKRCTTWEFWLKFYLGAKWGLQPGSRHLR